jgi:hypothetical protein
MFIHLPIPRIHIFRLYYSTSTFAASLRRTNKGRKVEQRTSIARGQGLNVINVILYNECILVSMKNPQNDSIATHAPSTSLS